MRFFRTDRRGNPIPWFQRGKVDDHHAQQQEPRPQHAQRYSQRQQLRHHHVHPQYRYRITGRRHVIATTTTPTTRSRYPHLPQLFFLVQNQSWPMVIARAKSHAHEICVQEDVSGNTPLHMACRLNPTAEAVQALLEASFIPNTEGAIPLHIAATHQCSVEVMKVLLLLDDEDEDHDDDQGEVDDHHGDLDQDDDPHNDDDSFRDNDEDDVNSSMEGHYPNYAMISPTCVLTRMGRAPIHYACFSFRGLSLPAFQLLLEVTLKNGHVFSTTTNVMTTTMITTSMTDHVDDDDVDELEDFMDDDDDDEYLKQRQESFNHDDDNVNTNDEFTSPTMPKLNVVTLRDLTGQTPLGLLFRRYRERVRIVIQSMERLQQSRHPSMQYQRRLHPLAAALRVQADLGELWDKARWIVTRLAQEAKPFMLTTRTRTQIGGDGGVGGDYYIDSPGEHAIAHEAAQWACERLKFTPLHPLRPLSTSLISSSTTTQGSSSSATANTWVTKKSKRHFRIVHASVSLTGYGCPSEMIRLALSIHPHQAKEMDEDGCLPIHLCAMAPSLVFNDDSSVRYASTNATNFIAGDDDSSFVSQFSFFSHTTTATNAEGAVSGGDSSHNNSNTNTFAKVFKILLQHYPAAARIPHGVSGKLPLILALETRTWTDGIQTLLDVYPAALESKKWNHMGLYPYILARIGNRTNNTTSNSSTSSSTSKQSRRKACHAVFELLKAKPDLVMS